MIGNGDILTWYEHRNRAELSGAHATMVGRGALVKPWIFREVREGREWAPSALERVGVYARLCENFKDHFRADELGVSTVHGVHAVALRFFCRYRPLPESAYGAMAAEHPLLQTRLGIVESESSVKEAELSRLERILRSESEEAHAALSAALWDADGDVARAAELCEAVGAEARWRGGRRRKPRGGWGGRDRGGAATMGGGGTPSGDDDGDGGRRADVSRRPSERCAADRNLESSRRLHTVSSPLPPAALSPLSLPPPPLPRALAPSSPCVRSRTSIRTRCGFRAKRGTPRRGRTRRS